MYLTSSLAPCTSVMLSQSSGAALERLSGVYRATVSWCLLAVLAHIC
jgi:hypothetical protein